MISRDLLLQLNASMIGANSRGREVTDIGPFRLMLLPGSSDPWTNFAVPTSDEVADDQIMALISAFTDKGVGSRLEILEDLWPAIPPALKAHGFEVEAHLPIMICDRSSFQPAETRGAEMVGDLENLHQVSQIEAEAFEAPYERDERRLASRQEGIRDGRLLVATIADRGTPAASAMLTIEGDVAELVAVATKVAHRRKGFSKSVCSLLLGHYFATGGELVWLSTADPSLYESHGFKRAGHQVNMTRPLLIG